MSHAQTAQSIASLLELELPPVALAFVEEPPAGLGASERAVPSACAFWRDAERGVFYARADEHFNCPIGAMVLGWGGDDHVQANLGSAVEMMCDVAYLGADEPANIPSVDTRSSGIVYGPLAELPVDPDVVLFWVGSRQAMLVSEAAGNSRWLETAPRTVFGRPACASIPSALDSGQPVLSLGCAGMRTFTEVLPDRLLGVVPGTKLEEFERSLSSTVEANRRMQAYYDEQKERVG